MTNNQHVLHVKLCTKHASGEDEFLLLFAHQIASCHYESSSQPSSKILSISKKDAMNTKNEKWIDGCIQRIKWIKIARREKKRRGKNVKQQSKVFLFVFSELNEKLSYMLLCNAFCLLFSLTPSTHSLLVSSSLLPENRLKFAFIK